MIKSIIVDTDPTAVAHLKKCLEVFDLIDVVAEEYDFFSAIKSINKHQPQLVFLEIELDEYSGFKLLDCFEDSAFKSVFVTKRDTDAIRAFRAGVNGYVVKAVSREKLDKVLNSLIPQILSASRIERKLNGRLVLPAPSGFYYMSSMEIVYLSSEGKNTLVYKTDGTSFLIPKNLKNCQLLLGSPFVRVHRSFIVNLHFIQTYTKGNDPHVIMENNARVEVGRQYKESLDELLQYILK